MIFSIAHTLAYTYDRPVFLEPHVIRLQPRQGPFQHPRAWRLDIDPAPSVRTPLIDAEGNLATWAWFGETTAHLRIEARTTVETRAENPFDFLLEDGAREIPLRLGGRERVPLAPCLERAADDPAVKRLVEDTVSSSGPGVLDFLGALNQRLYETVPSIHREEGEPYPPAETLRRGRGACRDTAVLFMDCCRSVGIPARFASGYQHAPDPERSELHAWPEVYLPGAGWRGYDPSRGLVVTDEHVAVATGSHPAAAAPVSGTFRGTGARSRIRTRVHTETRPDD